jgi:hypothetical protein
MIPTTDPNGPSRGGDPVKGAAMDAKGKRKVIAEMLDKLKADMPG